MPHPKASLTKPLNRLSDTLLIEWVSVEHAQDGHIAFTPNLEALPRLSNAAPEHAASAKVDVVPAFHWQHKHGTLSIQLPRNTTRSLRDRHIERGDLAPITMREIGVGAREGWGGDENESGKGDEMLHARQSATRCQPWPALHIFDQNTRTTTTR